MSDPTAAASPDAGKPATAAPPSSAVTGSPQSNTTQEPKRKEEEQATCDAGGMLFLIALTMLLGFSERFLTNLEGRVMGAGPRQSGPETPTGQSATGTQTRPPSG
jgi:hypothetical protein